MELNSIKEIDPKGFWFYCLYWLQPNVFLRNSYIYFSQHVAAPLGLVSVSASQSVSCRAHFRMDQHHHDHSQLRVQKSVKELYCFMEWYEILKTVKSKIYNFKHFLLSKHNPRGTIVVQYSVLSKKYFYPQVCHIPF